MAGFRRPRASGVRLFFATDLHGSTFAFRKFLGARRFYDADVLLLGGDLSGKRIDAYDSDCVDARRVEQAEREGVYLWRGEADSLRAICEDPDAEQRIFDALARERVEEWLERAEASLAETQTPCFVIAGNDDPPGVVEALAAHPGPLVRFCEEHVLEFPGGYAVAGFGWRNRTPWKTPRETDETEIEARLRGVVDSIPDPRRTILNVHVPPHGVLDVCPELDTSVDPPRPLVRGGQVSTTSVGSTAVRDVLLDVQPLVACCGHVHEEHGARRLGAGTLVVNPGSEFSDGILRGAIIRLGGQGNVDYQLTSG